MATSIWAQAPARGKPAAAPKEPAPAEYKWRELPEPDPPLPKSVPPAVRDAMKGGNFSDEAAEYLKHRLAEFTWRRNLARQPELRKRLLNDLRGATGSAHDRAIRETHDQMKLIVGDTTFEPTVRYNAMLLIGELNDRESGATDGAATQAAPMAAAAATLLENLKGDRARNSAEDTITLAAMAGVARHLAAGGGDGELRRRAATTLLAMVKAEQRPSFRSAEGHAFLRARAASMLATLGLQSLGENGGGEALTGLLRMVADQEAPAWMRFKAAEAVGSLNWQGLANVNYSLAARLVGELAVDTTEKLADRRERKAYLDMVAEAMSGRREDLGLVSATPAEQAPYVQEIQKRVTAIVKVLDDRKLEDDQVDRPLVEAIDGLKEWIEDEANEVKRELLPGTEFLR